MLQAIRDKTSGWIAYLIIGLISVPFALWGINSYLGGGEEQPAAVVNGNEISARDLDQAYARYRERLLQVFGGKLPDIFQNENVVKEQVLSQLIEERVLIDYIEEQGYRVGPKALFREIAKIPSFQKDGRFDKELYQAQLRSQGYSPALFELELRRQLEMKQPENGIKLSALVPAVAVDQALALQQEKRKLRLLTIPARTDSVEVSDQEIEDFYQKQSGRFMQPARVKLDYIELNLDTVKQGIDVDENALRQRYEEQREQLTTPETREARHILITVPDGADDATVEAARQKLLDLKKRIDAGEDFAALAREFSQDPGSAADGGSLGEVEKGMMVKPFEDALFALQPGQVSDPVRTQFGWHLIRLDGINPGGTQPFEEVRGRLADEIKTEKAEAQIYDLAETLANIGYEEPDSLQPAADQLGLPIRTTDWFTRSQGQGLAANEKIRQIAFSEDVLNQKRNSDLIELGENNVAIVHLNAHEPEKLKPLDEVRDQIVVLLKKQKAREQAKQSGQQLLGKIRKGELDLQQAAEQSGGELKEVGAVARDDNSIVPELRAAAFAMPKPEDGKPRFQGVAGVNGDYSIIELDQVDVDASAITDEARQTLLKKMRAEAGNYDYQAFLKALVEQAEIQRTPVKELQ